MSVVKVGIHTLVFGIIKGWREGLLVVILLTATKAFFFVLFEELDITVCGSESGFGLCKCMQGEITHLCISHNSRGD